MDNLIASFEEEARALMSLLERGAITTEQWYEFMQRLLVRYHLGAMMIGTGLTTLPQEALAMVATGIETGQMPYLRNFKTVINASGEFNPAWFARAALYARSPKVAYWEGRIYQDAGKFLPLPAMPAQGTQCHTNCKCSWRIEKRGPDDWDCYWVRDADDSCQTCVQREADWNPYRIRDGVAQL